MYHEPQTSGGSFKRASAAITKSHQKFNKAIPHT